MNFNILMSIALVSWNAKTPLGRRWASTASSTWWSWWNHGCVFLQLWDNAHSFHIAPLKLWWRRIPRIGWRRSWTSSITLRDRGSPLWGRCGDCGLLNFSFGLGLLDTLDTDCFFFFFLSCFTLEAGLEVVMWLRERIRWHGLWHSEGQWRSGLLAGHGIGRIWLGGWGLSRPWLGSGNLRLVRFYFFFPNFYRDVDSMKTFFFFYLLVLHLITC